MFRYADRQVGNSADIIVVLSESMDSGEIGEIKVDTGTVSDIIYTSNTSKGSSLKARGSSIRQNGKVCPGRAT